ncbi:MAG: hypothetical protein KDC79_06945 [Cyclobacteriaceae bacterium]|nr:hypothetical protein [Cyclobacteriaceae bacterium]
MKLFRKIRQNLLSTGRIRNYLKYAIGEIVLVVIGILLALQINNWNVLRKQQAKTQVYYQQLLDDMKADKEYARFLINKFESQRAAYNKYLEKFNTPAYTKNAMYKDLLALNMESYSINFDISTLESLQNSGEIVLLPPDLRNKLLDLRLHMQKVTADERLDNTSKSEVVEHLSILMGEKSLEERLSNQKVLKKELNLERNKNEIILSLEAIQGWMNFSELKSIHLLKEITKEIDAVEKMIVKEVRK